MVTNKFEYLFDLEKGQSEAQALKFLRQIPVYKACLKKLNYRNKMGYILPKDLATLAAFWLESFNTNMRFVQNIRTVTNCALDFCERLLFRNMPIYVVTEDFDLSLKNTHFSDKLIPSLKISVPYGIILVPFQDKEGKGVRIFWYYFRHVDLSHSFWKKDEIFSRNYGEMFAGYFESNKFLEWITVLENFDLIGGGVSLGNPSKSGSREAYFDILSPYKDGDEQLLIQENKQASILILDYLLSIISLFNFYPERISVDKKSQHRGFSKNTKKSSQLPLRIIGSGYKIKKSYQGAKIQNSDNSHNSPIAHWRKGHWRNQPYGDRSNPHYILKWIEPMLINAYKDQSI